MEIKKIDDAMLMVVETTVTETLVKKSTLESQKTSLTAEYHKKLATIEEMLAAFKVEK